jgi:hypothetical protein
MKTVTTLFLVPFLALAASACGSNGSSGSPPVACTGTTLTANEANDYAFTSTITLPLISVQPRTELLFDWGSIAKDMLSHDINAKTDLNNIAIVSWGVSLAELEAGLNADDLPMNAITGIPLSLLTDGSTTSAKLFTFTLNGGAIAPSGGAITPDAILDFFDADKYPPATNTYTMMAATGTVVGQNAKMLQAFVLDKNSTNTTVKMTSDSTKLTYKADLHSLKPTGISAGQAAITLDWTNIKKNALGATFDATAITRALIGHYSQSIAEIEKRFLDLEIMTSEIYQGNIPIGTTVDFSTLATSNGTKFPGIDTSGTWIVALQCGNCRNPAPWYLSVLKVCTP